VNDFNTFFVLLSCPQIIELNIEARYALCR